MASRRLTPDEAEAVALGILGHLAGDPDLLGPFLGYSGSGPADLAGRVGDPAFLGGVLDFLLADEERLLAVTVALDMAPDLPMRARRLLPGADPEA